MNNLNWSFGVLGDQTYFVSFRVRVLGRDSNSITTVYDYNDPSENLHSNLYANKCIC